MCATFSHSTIDDCFHKPNGLLMCVMLAKYPLTLQQARVRLKKKVLFLTNCFFTDQQHVQRNV